jgi:hypothetical protein
MIIIVNLNQIEKYWKIFSQGMSMKEYENNEWFSINNKDIKFNNETYLIF